MRMAINFKSGCERVCTLKLEFNVRKENYLKNLINFPLVKTILSGVKRRLESVKSKTFWGFDFKH